MYINVFSYEFSSLGIHKLTYYHPKYLILIKILFQTLFIIINAPNYTQKKVGDSDE